MSSDAFRELIPGLRELESGGAGEGLPARRQPTPEDASRTDYSYSILPVLISLTKVGELHPSWTAEYGQWTIANCTRASSSRVKVTAAYRGFHVDPLGKQPPMMNMTLQYAPLGHTGMDPRLRRHYGRRWEKPILDLEDLETEEVLLKIGKITWGTYVLRSVNSNLQKLLLLQDPSFAHRTDVAPRIVECQLVFVGKKDEVRRISPAARFISGTGSNAGLNIPGPQPPGAGGLG